MTSKQDYIKEAAYFIWLNRGKPEGQDLEIWDEATKIYELTQEVLRPISKKEKTVAKKAPAKKTSAKKAKKTAKAVATKKAPAKKVAVKKPVAKKAPAKKTVTKKPVAKKAPAKKAVEVAKIIPMVKKGTPAKKAAAPKTKIKIVIGKKK